MPSLCVEEGVCRPTEAPSLNTLWQKSSLNDLIIASFFTVLDTGGFA
jgi:hypothetical protein